MIPLSDIPFGATFERFGEMLVNRALADIFGPDGASRSTRVLIFNHTSSSLFFLTASFDSGGFSNSGEPPGEIVAQSAAGYRIESHGFATGVTDAVVQYGYQASDQQPCLTISTSNPFAGDNSWNAVGQNGVVARFSGTVGDANEVQVDVYATE